MKYLLSAIFPLLIVACSTTPTSDTASKNPPKQTKACMEYQSMMTAPIEPNALEKLEQKCAASLHLQPTSKPTV